MVSVSILIPTYNRYHYLREAVESCGIQCLPDMEIIIVNDGSTDSTANYLETIQRKNVIAISQNNSGLCISLNRGIERARGKYIMILNDDDRLVVDSCETLYRTLEADPALGAVFGENIVIDERGRRRFRVRVTDPERHLRWMGRVWRWSKPMVRTDVARRIGGFRQEYDRVEDIDFYLRLRATEKLAMIACPVYEYRVHRTGSMIQRQHTFIMPSLRMRLRHLDEGLIRPYELSRWYLYNEKIRMASFYGHPEIAEQVLEAARQRNEPFTARLESRHRFYRSWAGKKVTRIWLFGHGMKHAISGAGHSLTASLRITRESRSPAPSDTHQAGERTIERR